MAWLGGGPGAGIDASIPSNGHPRVTVLGTKDIPLSEREAVAGPKGDGPAPAGMPNWEALPRMLVIRTTVVSGLSATREPGR